jgi:hypothetical protein
LNTRLKPLPRLISRPISVAFAASLVLAAPAVVATRAQTGATRPKSSDPPDLLL